MTANNVGALLVTKSEADGAIAGIVTERGESPSIWFLEDLVCKHFFSVSSFLSPCLCRLPEKDYRSRPFLKDNQGRRDYD